MPAANSGASSPLSAASASGMRIADTLLMMDEETGPRRSASGETRISEDFVQGARVVGSIGPNTLFAATLTGLVKVIEQALGAVVG
jgi:hypothetical protein